MSKTAKTILLSLSLTVVLFCIIGGLGVKASTDDGAYRQLGVFSEVLHRIRNEYVEEPKLSAVTTGALHGLLESLDANSSYLTAEEYKRFKSRKNEGKAGIGAIVSKRFGYAAVVSVIPGGPADKAGLDDGDILEAIEGKSSRELSLAEIHGLLEGQPGSNLTVAVVRARRAEPVKTVITRDVTQAPSPLDKVVEEGIGYLKVQSLAKGKSAEIANKIRALQKSGVKKLALDLRDVADGEPAEGVAVANLFLDHGTIAYLQGQKFSRQDFNADPAKTVTNLPVVVLVNRGTGGAAEIVAAALLGNARADVLGDKTFGLGSEQKTIELADGSALILSVAKYYSPAGKAIQDTAVTPNILVADKDDSAALAADEEQEGAVTESLKKERDRKRTGNDEQLQRAIEVLKNGEKPGATTAAQAAAGANK